MAVLLLVVAIGALGPNVAPPPPSSPASSASPTSAPAVVIETPSPTPAPTGWVGVPAVATGPATPVAEPYTLTATGIETVSADDGASWRAVSDASGAVWALGNRLYRYDLATGVTRAWSVDDDARFTSNDLLAAREGGVWIVGERIMRRFDGRGFAAAVDIGAYIVASTTGPDGSVWAATDDGKVVHVSGSTRTVIDGLAPQGGAAIVAIAVDSAGHVWCAWSAGRGRGGTHDSWVARYDGTTWRFFTAADSAPIGAYPRQILPLPDGSIVVVGSGGLARFDSATWTVLAPTDLPLDAISLAAAAPDGSIWILRNDGSGSINGVARLVPPLWALGATSDVPPDSDTYGVNWMIASGADVLIGVGNGIFRSDGHWVRAIATPAVAGPGWAELVAVSRDRAWATDGSSVWEFLNGSWSAPTVPAPDAYVTKLLRSPDGTVWAATDQNGTFALGGGAWARVDTESWMSDLALDRSGVVWMVGSTSDSFQDQVVRAFERVGGEWREKRMILPPLDLLEGHARLAVGRDGAVWLGGREPSGGSDRFGLVRFADGKWARMAIPGHESLYAVIDLVVAPDGDLWVLGGDISTDGEQGPAWVARFDGTHWVEFGRASGLDLGYAQRIAVAGDGIIWVAAGNGLARYDGATWTVGARGVSFGSLSVAPDGAVWMAGPTGVERYTPSETTP